VATPEEAEEIYRQKSSYMEEVRKSASDQEVQPEEPSPAQAGSGEAEGSQKK
jgi:hypothetical protein